MKHPIKIVMLPTEDKSLFAKCIKSGVFAENEGDLVLTGKHTTTLKSNDVWEYQHLYITVSQDVEPIKEGDWCIGEEGYPTNNWNAIEGFEENYRKIIATTNSKLFTLVECPVRGADSNIKYILPQVQQSFLKEFVKNPNGEYEVEYKDWCDYDDDDPSGLDRPDLRLIVNQDNTVNITSVEDKNIYTAKEVDKLCSSAWQTGFNVGYNDEYSPSGIEYKHWKDFYLKQNTSVEEKMYSGIDLMGNQDGSLDHFLLNSSKFSQEDREVIMDAVHDWIKKTYKNKNNENI